MGVTCQELEKFVVVLLQLSNVKGQRLFSRVYKDICVVLEPPIKEVLLCLRKTSLNKSPEVEPEVPNPHPLKKKTVTRNFGPTKN